MKHIPVKKRYTISTPYTIQWWIEILTLIVARYNIHVERMNWDALDSDRELMEWIWLRTTTKLNDVIQTQKEICAKEYTLHTRDSNNYEFRGIGIRNYVMDCILNSNDVKLK